MAVSCFDPGRPYPSWTPGYFLCLYFGTKGLRPLELNIELTGELDIILNSGMNRIAAQRGQLTGRQRFIDETE